MDSTTFRLYLDRTKDQLEFAKKASDSEKYLEAKMHYELAAEWMQKAADVAPQGMKAKYLSQVVKILEKARLMAAKAQAQTQQSAPIPQPIASDEEQKPPWLVERKPNVTFDDVAGLEEVKEQIRLKFILPFEHQDKAEYYGIGSGGGILLYGPPGTGKTLIAKATAGELDADFFVVKASDIMSKWVGKAEENVHKLFEAARARERAIIFIDEIEALLPRRGGGRSTVMKRVVPQFLAEMDGFMGRAPNVLFIGATNEPWAMDPAVLRPGRFDARIYVPLPDETTRRRILEIHLKNRPLADDVDLDALAARMEGYSGADVAAVCHRASQRAFMEAIAENDLPPIGWDDFEAALAEIKPSVDAKNLERYEKYANRL